MARLSVGDRFPDFQIHTAYDADLQTAEIIKKADKTVFWVLRYIGCTTCRYDVHLIKKRYQEFQELGAQVLVVLQSQPETVRADLAGDEVPYEIIADPEQKFYQRFSIESAPSKEARQPKEPADVEKWQTKLEKVKASGFVHGKYEGNEQQLPALFIVGPDSAVQYVHYAKNSIDMPTVDELLLLLGKQAS
jgi:peroxiredoxin